MTAYDGLQVTRSCFSGRNFLLWKAEYEELTKKKKVTFPKVAKKVTRVSMDVLMGSGD